MMIFVKPMQGLRLFAFRMLIAALLPLAIAACSKNSNNGILGKSNGPDHLIVTAATAATGATFFDMYECFRTTVRAILVFDDGSSGDFTTRVVWSSSSPGTVTVSNGDQPIPNTPNFYANGVVTPVGSGSATITANYFGLKASIGVNVGTPQELTIKRVLQGNTVLLPTDFKMGVGTVEDLTVVGTLNGQEQNIEGPGVAWTFETPNDGEALIDATNGKVTGLSAGPTLLAKVGFDSCTLTMTAPLTVDNVVSISATPEYNKPATLLQPQLVVGNTEKIKVFAHFASGPDQDISTQVALVTSDAGIVALGTAGGIPNIANAVIAGGPVDITATFTQGGVELVSTTQVTTVLATLESINVTSLPPPPNNPATPTAADTAPPDCRTADYTTPRSATAFTGSTIPVQFCAQGLYDGGSIVQDITRGVTWSLSDTTIARISTSGGTSSGASVQTAGQALATSTQTGTVEVTATPIAGSTAAPVMSSLTISN